VHALMCVSAIPVNSQCYWIIQFNVHDVICFNECAQTTRTTKVGYVSFVDLFQ